MIAHIHLGKHGAEPSRFPNKIDFEQILTSSSFPSLSFSQPLTRCDYILLEQCMAIGCRSNNSTKPYKTMKRPHLLHQDMKDMISDWSMLCTDLIQEIAIFLLAGDVVDYIGLRAACKAWRSATADPRNATFHVPPPRSWAMLCSDGDAGDSRRFFHLSTGKSLRLRLPELDNHKIIGCADGLLVLQDKATTAVRLLNPFTRSLAHLPPLTILLEDELDHVQVTSAAVAFSLFSGLSTAMLSFYHLQRLAFANVGDGEWVIMDRLENFHFTSTLCYEGQFYATDYNGSIAVCNIGPPATVTPIVTQSFDRHVMNSYMVESAGDLLLVRRYYSSAISGGFVDTSKFEVFKVNLGGRPPRLVPMKSLGDRALFLAQNRTLSVSAKDFLGIRGNSIYFGVCSLQDSAGVFHLDDGSFESLSYHQGVIHGGKAGKELLCRPFSLFDHLLCYCEHKDWSKGVMYSGFY